MIKPYVQEKLQIGQIRRALFNDGSAALLVIGKVNPISATCDVFLLDRTTDAASVRDLVYVPRVNDEFTFSLMRDYSGNMDSSTLLQSLVYGQICSFCTSEIVKNSEKNFDNEINFPFNHECFMQGENQHALLSNEWTYRTDRYAKFSEICNQYVDIESFFAVREFMNFYSHTTSINSAISSMPEDVKLSALKESFNSNPYARMLVRC